MSESSEQTPAPESATPDDEPAEAGRALVGLMAGMLERGEPLGCVAEAMEREVPAAHPPCETGAGPRCCLSDGHPGVHRYKCASALCPGLTWPASTSPHHKCAQAVANEEMLKMVDCARASGGSVVCTDEASARRLSAEHGGDVRRSERRGAATITNPDPAPGWLVDFGSALSVVDVKVTLQPSPKVSATFTLESLAKQALVRLAPYVGGQR